jgi:ABC-type transport system involved in multi-copper enzyme maturation permease subunit
VVGILSVVWASAVKDIKSAWAEKSTLVQTLSLPSNYWIAMILFAFVGSFAPTAVVMLDHGPYAQGWVNAMRKTGSFRLNIESAAQARQQMRNGTLVALVTIPANFDRKVANHHFVTIPCQIDGLNQDLTDDAERGMRLADTIFYNSMRPPWSPATGPAGMVVQQHNEYPTTLGYIPFLSISIFVLAAMVSGMLQGGNAAARDYEDGTVKSLLLAPAPRLAILAGRMLGAFIVSLPAAATVLALIIFVAGDYPAHLLLMTGVCLLTLAVFVCLGTALGLLVKDRATVAMLVRAIPVPLLFLSGVFGSLTYQTRLVQDVGIAQPAHYAIVLEQLAFRGYSTGALTPVADALILCAYMGGAVLVAAAALKFTRMEKRLA